MADEELEDILSALHEDLGFAVADLDRPARLCDPEVVPCAGKNASRCVSSSLRAPWSPANRGRGVASCCSAPRTS